MKKPEASYKHDYVMLIDDVDLDNFINEKLIQLNSFSKHVYVQTNAGEALLFLNKLAEGGANFPEFIFIDINMPLVDGFQFITSFQKSLDKKLNYPKLVILTSSLFEKDREDAVYLSDKIVFINKPLSGEILDTL